MLYNPAPWIHPLMFGALGLIGGITTQSVLWPYSYGGVIMGGLLWLVVGLTLLGVVLCSFYGFSYGRQSILLSGIFFCAGVIQTHRGYSRGDSMQKIVLSASEPVCLQGTIISKEFLGSPYVRQSLAVEGFLTHAPHEKVRVLVYSRAKTPDYTVGDTLVIRDCRMKAAIPEKFGLYLFKEGYDFFMYLSPRQDSQKITRPDFSLNRTIFDFRQRIYTALRGMMDHQTGILFALLFLGNKASDKKDLLDYQTIFKNWGISHYLARSGLHMTLFALVIGYFLRSFALSFAVKVGITLVAALFYCLASWPSISFMRAWCMFLFYSSAQLLAYGITTIHVLILVFCGMALYNPFYIFFLDFQLSFLLTFALCWWFFFRRILYNRTLERAPKKHHTEPKESA